MSLGVWSKDDGQTWMVSYVVPGWHADLFIERIMLWESREVIKLLHAYMVAEVN